MAILDNILYRQCLSQMTDGGRFLQAVSFVVECSTSCNQKSEQRIQWPGTEQAIPKISLCIIEMPHHSCISRIGPFAPSTSLSGEGSYEPVARSCRGGGRQIPWQMPGQIPGEVCPGMYGESSGPILLKVCRIFTDMVQLCMPQYEKN